MTRDRHPLARRWGALAAATAFLLAACSDDEEEPTTEQETTTTAAPTAADRLDQAREVLTDAGSVRLVMTSANLPEETPAYIIGAEGSGTMDPPAFAGTITAKVAGIQAEVPTVAVDDTLYVKLPFAPDYIATSPEDLNVPDPARLFDVEEGLVSFLSETVDPTFGEQSRVGREVVQTVTGTVPGQAVIDLLFVGDADAEFDVVYGLVEETWQVRTVEITGPFYPQQDSTYTVTLDQYGTPVTVTAP